MSMTFCLNSLYCSMESAQKTSKWLDPGWQLFLTFGLSLFSAVLAFRSVEMERQTLITFVAYYLILASMAFLFKQRISLTDAKTRQLLQFGFFLLGFVLTITGILGVFGGNFEMSIVFVMTVLLPGIAMVRAGRHFNKIGE
jgi:fatty-acid desaturase